MSALKLAVVVSHPIQHFCPQYCSWASIAGLELKVFFASRHGLEAYHDPNFDKTIRWQGIKLHFEHEFLPGAESMAIDSRIDCPELAGRLEVFEPDAVLVYGYNQALQRRAIAWTHGQQKLVLMAADSERRSSRSIWRTLAKKMFLPRVFGKVDYFLTVGDANEAYYRSYGVGDLKFIRASFSIDRVAFDKSLVERDERRKNTRQKWQIPDDHIVVLMVGKLVPWKRQLDLVRASNQLHKDGRNVTVILAGTGPDEASLRSACLHDGAGGVIFAGFIQPEQLTDYYFAADIYAHCSEVEPHALAISEAIYAGLPVILSDRCGSYGPSDDVRPGLNGWTYNCGDVAELVRIIRVLEGHTNLLRQMGEESLAIGRYNQSLAHDKAIKQVLNLHREARS